ncbi:MAG: tryptophan--tRNA ligase [Bacteroidia bacterium]
MSRILTGIQSSGKPHLGNILGAILPALSLAEKELESAFFFIADLHAFTSLHDPQALQESIFSVATTWLACGLNPEKDIFFVQSHRPEVCELAWYFQCLTPYPMLANAHSFKEKAHNLSHVSAGLFTYPVLMAADILLYQAQTVPVGKDQTQHLEITRDIAGTFNRTFGEVFPLPQPHFQKDLTTLPGIDGRKMSKTYRNTLDIFAPETELKKRIFQIVTDSTPLHAPKNPDTCTVFKLYAAIASAQETENLRQKYLTGTIGYGQAKQLLFESLLDRFHEIRQRYAYWYNHPEKVRSILAYGASRAHPYAQETLEKVRSLIGTGLTERV